VSGTATEAVFFNFKRGKESIPPAYVARRNSSTDLAICQRLLIFSFGIDSLGIRIQPFEGINCEIYAQCWYPEVTEFASGSWRFVVSSSNPWLFMSQKLQLKK
jgi:hypothetical protein